MRNKQKIAASKSEIKGGLLEAKSREFINKLREERRLSALSLAQYEREIKRLIELVSCETASSSALIEPIRAHLTKLSPATVIRKLIVWKSFSKFADPSLFSLLNEIRLPRLRQKQPLFLTEQESFALEHACYRSEFLNRDRLLVALMLQLGMRLSEVLNLKYRNFEGDWILMMRKGEKEQRLPLSPQLRTLYAALRDERHGRDDDFIFEGREGRPITPRGAQGIIERLRKAAKIEKRISPHALRHTFASTLASRGASLVALKEILGHRKITTTERYLHVTPDHLRETLNLIK